MKLQKNFNRTFLFLVLLVGSAMFCMAQNIGNMGMFSFNGGFQGEGNGKTGLFSLNTANSGERIWQKGNIPLKKMSYFYDDSYDFVLNVALFIGIDTQATESDFAAECYFFGSEVELCIFKYLGIQTGLQILPNIDYSFYEPILTNTVGQIPILVKFNLPLFELWELSIYGGIGFNLFSIANENMSVRSFSKMSYIFGGKWTIAIANLNVFMAYQFNADFSETVYRIGGQRFNYLAERSIMYVGMGWYIPLD